MGLHCSKQQFIVAKCLVMIVCAIIDAVKGDTTAELYGKTRYASTFDQEFETSNPFIF